MGNIAIFDSGIGGLTFLKTARARLPYENFIYYADTDNVPYGTKSLEQVRELASKAVAAATSKAASAPAKSAQKAPVVDEPDGSDEEEGDEPDAVVPPTPAPANSPVLKSFDDF